MERCGLGDGMTLTDVNPARDDVPRRVTVASAPSTSSTVPTTPLWRPWLPFLLTIALIGAIVGIRLATADDPESTPPARGAVTIPTSADIEATYGVRFIGVDVTAGGGMIQIRYQVLDTDKTSAIHDVDAAPYVIDAAGHKYADPGMMGHSHVGRDKAAGTTDFVLLANAGGGVQPGAFVTIKVGTLELRDVPVQ